MHRVRLTCDSVEELRTHWLDMIDDLADKSSPPQRAVYAVKHQEAVAGGGPHIELESEARGVSVEEMCHLVCAARARADDISARVEGLRVAAKLRCQQATEASEMLEAYREFRRQL